MLPSTLVPGSYVNLSVRAELNWTVPIAVGAKKMAAKRVQEWLEFAGFGTPIDSDFGPATQLRVRDFQASKNLPVTGTVDINTFEALVDPLVKAVAPLGSAGKTLSQLVCEYARQHVKIHPIELGGENSGPWVRAYMGWEGKDAKWCAGFACFMLEQACNTLGMKVPIPTSASCDALALAAKHAGKFVSGAAIANGSFPVSNISPGSFFLLRKTPSDWTHVGVVSDAQAGTFRTFEGNTDSAGTSNGFEATARARGYARKDFIVW